MKIQMVSGLYLHELPSFVTVAFRNWSRDVPV
jgi:hypothetical protein